MVNASRVLIVDDSRLIRKTILDSITCHFDASQMTVMQAEDGDIALSLMDTFKPEVIILDIMMQRVNGLEVLSKLTPLTAAGKVVVIMMTGMDDDQALAQCFKLGAKDFIRKPIHEVELISRLEGALQNHALIKDLHSLNQALIEAKNQSVQAEKMAAVGQLAAGVAHEINNPVGFISSNIATLQSYYALWKSGDQANFKRIEADIPDLFEDLNIGIRRIKEIVDSLRSFSRIDNVASLEAFDIEQGIRDTLVVARHRYRYVAHVQTDFQGIPRIYCNGGKINQVMMNLIVNASDAIRAAQDQDQREGLILISTHYDDSDRGVKITVRDNGIGMSESVQQEIFNPFYTTKPVGSGTGLGLSVSYDIVVHEHGGKFEVASFPGQGSTFTLFLPLAREGEKHV